MTRQQPIYAATTKVPIAKSRADRDPAGPLLIEGPKR